MTQCPSAYAAAAPCQPVRGRRRTLEEVCDLQRIALLIEGRIKKEKLRSKKRGQALLNNSLPAPQRRRDIARESAFAEASAR